MTRSPTCESGGRVPLGTRALRALAISLVGGAILWFGHTYAPIPEARATVYQDLGQVLEGVPKFMEARVREGEVQTAFLNGNKLYYTLSSTPRPIAEVLDWYENLYAVPAPKRKASENAGFMAELRKKNADMARAFPEFERLLTRGSFRAERHTFGMFGAVRAGDEGLGNWEVDSLKRLTAFAESGRFGDLGEVKAVYALRPKGSTRTTVFTVWPDPESNARALRIPADGDVPGADIAGVARPPDSRRLLSFGQDMAGVSFRIASYEEEHDRAAAADGWATRLAAEGWKEDLLARRRTEGSAEGTGLFLTRAGQEAFVRVKEDPRTGNSRSAVFVSRRPAR